MNSGSCATACNAAAICSLPLLAGSPCRLSRSTALTSSCGDKSTVARKLVGSPLAPPEPPGSGMPQRRISRSFASTFLPCSTSSKSLPFLDSCRSDEPLLPNRFRMRQKRWASLSNITSTNGSPPPVQPTYWSQCVDVWGSSKPRRIAATTVDLPRSFGPYSTLSPGPNSTSTFPIAAKLEMLSRWSFIHRARHSRRGFAAVYRDAPGPE